MVAHLPWAFDSSFWGNNNTISATAALNQIVKGISAGSYEQGTAASALPGWENIKPAFFYAGNSCRYHYTGAADELCMGG